MYLHIYKHAIAQLWWNLKAKEYLLQNFRNIFNILY